ncbi:MAG: ABC-F family ATP-binding cassette domain-containing protein [Ardenticatenaceae bacterium]|nr:ABC-F family ATP-binding cassette domain-containing protein [Ardenticatenaceae bacterium]
MVILSANELSQSFGANDIFSGIQLQLEAKERVGLVGPNGCGKTTLLLVLAGLHEPTTGTVDRRDELTLGYLRQEAVLTFAGQNNTVYEEMLTVFADLRQLETEMRRLEALMSSGELSEDVLAEYGRTQDQYDHSGGYQYQHDIKRVLLGLGFPQEEWETPLTHLSGGQKTRLLLGRLLLEKPDLLILDEPTNHLDVAAIEWLEQTLRRWEGALVIVSHDRYFLNRIVNRVWELTPTNLKSYRGNYTAYVRQRQADWEREMALFQSEKERLESELEFIRKHIAGGKTDIAKGKLKRLTRDIVLMEEVGVLAMQNKSWLHIGERVRTFSANEAALHIRSLKPPTNQPPRLNIRLEAVERSGRIVLRTGELGIGYPGTTLFTTDKIRLERLDCAALIGPNGSGKTTFLRTLLQELSTLDGWIKFGDSVIPGYFAQGHEQLNMRHRVIDEITTHRPEMPETEARNYLAQYLFKGDDVFKKVIDLSGGERGRLALSLLALDGANFLLLDEPTNHLDIPSQEVLQAVLEAFDGTILLVSHDRYLVDRLATQIWELRDGHLHVFEGSYNDYLIFQSETEDVEPEAAPPADALDWVEELAALPVGRHDQQRLAELEAQLAEYELLQEQIQDEIMAARNEQQLAVLRDELKVVQAELARLNREWVELSGQ